MDHNEFDFYNDLLDPLKDFLKRLNDNTINYDSIIQSECTTRLEIEKEGFVTLYSDIDDSCVDYHRDTKLFDIYFDSKLYEPPQRVVQYEKIMMEDAKKKRQALLKK